MMGIKEQVQTYERELLLAAMDAVGFEDGATLEDVAEALLCNREQVKHLMRKHGISKKRKVTAKEAAINANTKKLGAWK